MVSKELKPVNPKGNQCWIFFGRTDAEAEAPKLWPHTVKSWLIGKDWSWERLRAEGEGSYRGWDGWKASPTQWTWVWANSRRWWRTGKPGVLQSMRLQRVRHNWGTEQQRGLWPIRLLYAWNFPHKNSGVCCRILLQCIFPTQGSNPRLLHFRWILYHWATRKASIDKNSEECNRID